MRVFLLGKLPAHGDFVVRGMCGAEQAAWDGWGAEALDVLRTGADFEEAHARAAPWRFVARAEDGWRAGALAPSVDRVGRRYLVLLGAGDLDGATAAAAGAMLADAAEALIYEALARGLDADALVSAAQARFEAALLACEGAAVALRPTPVGDGAWWSLGAAPLSGARPPAGLLVRGLAAAAPGLESAA